MKIERFIQRSEDTSMDYLFVDEKIHSILICDVSDFYENIYDSVLFKNEEREYVPYYKMVDKWLKMYIQADEIIEYELNDKFDWDNEFKNFKELKENNNSINIFKKYTSIQSENDNKTEMG